MLSNVKTYFFANIQQSHFEAHQALKIEGPYNGHSPREYCPVGRGRRVGGGGVGGVWQPKDTVPPSTNHEGNDRFSCRILYIEQKKEKCSAVRLHIRCVETWYFRTDEDVFNAHVNSSLKVVISALFSFSLDRKRM